MTTTTKPPVSYSIPSFRSGDFGAVKSQLDKLAGLGFKWVTFTPTYRVVETDEEVSGSLLDIIIPDGPAFVWKYLRNKLRSKRRVHYLTLHANQTPMSELKTAVLAAVEKGFNVKIEPHLDWDITLNSNHESAWRMTMYFDPVDSKTLVDGYNKEVIAPIINIIRDAEKVPRPRGAGKPCYALTLGSELDISLFAFAAGWDSLKQYVQSRRADLSLSNPIRLAIGHKLNFDAFSTTGAARRKMKTIRESWGKSAPTPKEWKSWELAALGYLRDLDYVSFSFYPSLNGKLPTGFDWTKDSDANSIAKVANAFKGIAQELRKKIGKNVPLDIGEFGLGSDDVSEPFSDSPEDFVTPDGTGFKKNDKAHAKRRLYIKGMGKFLADNKTMFASVSGSKCCNYLPATFWTVKHFDFLGLWDYKIQVGVSGDGKDQKPIHADHSLFVDELLIEYIKKCNQRTYNVP